MSKFFIRIHLNLTGPNQKSMQVCCVSEHARDTGYSVDGASQENYRLWRKTFEAINIHVRQLAMNRCQGYDLPWIYGTTANNSKPWCEFERQWWRDQVGFRKLCVTCCCEICRCRRIFLCNIMSQQLNLYSLNLVLFFCFVVCLFTWFLLLLLFLFTLGFRRMESGKTIGSLL